MYWLLLIVGAVLVAGATEAVAATRKYRPAYWPEKWPTPPAEFLTAVAGAAKDYKVRPDDLVSIAFVESRFNPSPTHSPRLTTWNKIKHKVIGKSYKRWGDVYRAEDCRAYGIMGLMLFNFIGVPGGLPIGAPANGGNNITLNVRMAARLLRYHYERTGDWVSAIRAYNPGGGEEYYGRFRQARDTFTRARGQS